MTCVPLQTDFNNVVFDENNPEAVILGDIYKEFNWEKIESRFQKAEKIGKVTK